MHNLTFDGEFVMFGAKITEVCAVDPCYKFTWCLNACIRENYVEEKRARELQGFLDNIKKSFEKVLGSVTILSIL